MTRIDEMLSDEQLKAAVNASAASVPEDFIWNTERMIDHLPRKERYIVRSKLSVGLVLTIILCMLTVTAVAAVLLTGWELVEQEVLPMALENDSAHAPLLFTNEELQYIAALAEENGVTLSEDTMLALKNGLDMQERDAILQLAYDDFGPDPMLWTLEEQYWFHEALVQLGVQKVNDHLLPGEGDLTEAEALAKAFEYVTAQPDERKAYLNDPAAYTLHRSYQMSYHTDGSPAGAMWRFGFMEKEGVSHYEVLMDSTGERIAVRWEDMSEYEVNSKFSNDELARIVALAEENGITLSDNILRALEKGEGYWEEEVIMSLAKAQFGPYPGQWTLEEQYWFEETMVSIGFKDYNQCRVPGASGAEGELTYEEAYAKAKNYIIAHGWESDTSALDDREKYGLWRSYNAVHDEDGNILEPDWYFWFEPKDVNLPEYIVELDKSGNLTNLGHTAGLEERLAAGEIASYEVQDVFTTVYGSVPDWSPEVFVAYADALRRAGSSNSYTDTNYILPPEGALTSEQAIEIAVQLIGGNEIRVGGAYCFEVDGRAVWKVTIASDSNRISDMVEMDCMTGEILTVYETDPDGGAEQFYIPKSVWDAIPAPNPEGNG